MWSRFVTLAVPYFRSPARRQGIGLLGLLLGLLLTASGLNVVNSFVNCSLMTAIAERRLAEFFWLGLLWAGVFAASTVVAAFCRFSEETLGLRWREWLTEHPLDKYLAGQVYHRLNGRADVDNPDQRIAEDVKTFTTNALSLVLIGINSTIALISFSGILWSITPGPHYS
jgi:putative ATP-binding cassette transporter